ncbi:MAG: PDZ domain-containing protein [Acidimicrobiia bacterium]|nr:PDZ domain-containing protein [Acidimicrobiia bacterium]
MPVDDEDADDALGPGPPLPPDDRLWRHPSEVAWEPAAATIAAPHGRDPRVWPIAAAAGLTGAVLSVSVAVLLGLPDQPDVATRSAQAIVAQSVTATTGHPPVATTVAARPPSVWVGIEGSDVADDRIAALQPHTGGGVLVVSVRDDSPALAVGVRAEDVLIAVDNDPVTSMAALAAHLRARTPGETAVLTVVRDGATLDFPVVLGRRPR